MISIERKNKFIKKAKELGFTLEICNHNESHGNFKCLKCGDKFKRNTVHFLNSTKQCPACNPTSKHQKRTPNSVAKRLLKDHNLILDKSSFISMMDYGKVKCTLCGHEYEARINDICREMNHAKCRCIKKTHRTIRSPEEWISLFKSWGIIVVDPSKCSGTKKFKVRCAKCGTEWMDNVTRIRYRKNKCVECSGNIRVKTLIKTYEKKATLDTKSELQRLDEGLEKYYKEQGFDGTYFFEKDSVEQFNLLEKIRNVTKEHTEL